MSWRNGGSLKSADSFATGFAAGFVPAYQSSLDHKRDKEKMAMQEEKDMRLLQERERLARQRKGIGGAGRLSKEAAKDAAKTAQAWNEAIAMANTFGIHPSRENLTHLHGLVVSNDYDSSQSRAALAKEMQGASAITFPTTGDVWMPTIGSTTYDEPDGNGNPPTEEDKGDLYPVPFSNNTVGEKAVTETAALLNDGNPTVLNKPVPTEPEGGPPEAVAGAEIDAEAERDAVAGRIDDNQFASLGGSDQAMINAATTGTREDGTNTRLASVVPDSAVSVPATGSGDEARTDIVAKQITNAFSAEEIDQLDFGTSLNKLFGTDTGAYPLTNLEEAEVMGKITIHAPTKPIKDIGSIKEINAQLSALKDRNDEQAILYRQELYKLARDFNSADLPKVEGMSRDEALQFVQTGWQSFRNTVNPKILEDRYRQAMQVVQNPATMPDMPKTSEEFEGMWADIQAGGYGPMESIDDRWLDRFSLEMNRVGARQEFGDALLFDNISKMELEDLRILRERIRVSQFSEGTNANVVDMFISQKEGLLEKNAYAVLTEGANTPAEVSLLLSQIRFENQSDMDAGRTPRHSEDTIEHVEQLYSTLNASVEFDQWIKQGGGNYGAVVDVIVLIDEIPRLRQAIQLGPNEFKVPANEKWDITQLSGRATEDARKALSAFNTSISQNVKDLDIMQRQLMSTLPIAQRMQDIVQKNEMVLNFGGDVARSITSFAYGASSAGEVLSNLFDGKDDDYVVSTAELNQAMASQGFSQGNYTDWVESVVDPKTLSTAEQAAYFEGLAVLMTFRIGMSEGQSGQAMSNQDYKRLSSVLTGARTKEAFNAKLHAFMSDMIGKEEVMQTQLTKNYDVFSEENPFRPARRGATMQNLFDGSDSTAEKAYKAYSTPYKASVPKPEPKGEVEAWTTFVNLSPQSEDKNRFDARNEMIENYRKNLGEEATQELLEYYSKHFFYGIPTEQLETWIRRQESN